MEASPFSAKSTTIWRILAEDAQGLAAVASQPEGTRLYVLQYAVVWLWWTKCAVANLDPTRPAPVYLDAFSEEVRVTRCEERLLHPCEGHPSRKDSRFCWGGGG